MKKFSAIVFLWCCCFYISWRLLRGRRWNSIAADLEEVDGKRVQLTYMRTTTHYMLKEFP